MKSAELLSRTDATSWSRIAMVAAYFWPRLKTYCIFVPLLSAAVTWAVMYVPEPAYKQMMMLLLSLMIIFAPIKLAKRPDGDFTYTLPALGWEKCTVIFGFILVVIPLLVIATSEIVALLVIDGNESAVISAMGVSPDTGATMAIAGWTMVYAAVAACLWAVMSTGRSRAVNGVIAALVVLFGLTAIVGFIAGFLMALLSGEAGPNPAAIPFDYIEMAVGITIFIVFIIKSAKAISRREI